MGSVAEAGLVSVIVILLECIQLTWLCTTSHQSARYSHCSTERGHRSGRPVSRIHRPIISLYTCDLYCIEILTSSPKSINCTATWKIDWGLGKSSHKFSCIKSLWFHVRNSWHTTRSSYGQIYGPHCRHIYVGKWGVGGRVLGREIHDWLTREWVCIVCHDNINNVVWSYFAVWSPDSTDSS